MDETAPRPLPPAKRRLCRILGGDGRTLIVAMDHLSRLGRGVRLRDPARVLREAAAGGADAVLLRHGLAARHAAELGRMGLVLSLGYDLPAHDYGVELGLRLGADAVKVEAFPGSETLPDSRARLGPLAARCERWGMPLIAEMIPVSFAAKASHTPANVADAARLGADMGADVVKTYFTGDSESFAEVVALAQVPVVILGGSGGDDRSLFESLRAALDAGAVGAAVGRRVWTSSRPGRVAGALARMIHEDLGVDAALAEVSRTVVSRTEVSPTEVSRREGGGGDA